MNRFKYIAVTTMKWHMRHITFFACQCVSFSSSPRQSKNKTNKKNCLCLLSMFRTLTIFMILFKRIFISFAIWQIFLELKHNVGKEKWYSFYSIGNLIALIQKRNMLMMRRQSHILYYIFRLFKQRTSLYWTLLHVMWYSNFVLWKN